MLGAPAFVAPLLPPFLVSGENARRITDRSAGRVTDREGGGVRALRAWHPPPSPPIAPDTQQGPVCASAPGRSGVPALKGQLVSLSCSCVFPGPVPPQPHHPLSFIPHRESLSVSPRRVPKHPHPHTSKPVQQGRTHRVAHSRNTPTPAPPSLIDTPPFPVPRSDWPTSAGKPRPLSFDQW